LSATYDLIVLGAGPAGSSCARRAAELCLNVLVLEKSTFPRNKPCGAGLTDKALRLLGGEEESVAQRSFCSAEVAFGRDLSLIFRNPDTLVTTTTRRDFDALLMRRSESAGARVDLERVANALEEDGRGVTVSSGGDRMTASHVVVADGVRGTGRGMLGLASIRLGGGMYVRAFPKSGSMPDHLTERPLFDPTAARNGYGWILPKEGHLNVGVFSQRNLDSGLTRELEAFMTARGLDGWRTEGPQAFPIPVGRPHDALGTDRVLCAGDAAGLVNPITGEGISSAILSGRLAAESIAESLDSDHGASAAYARRVVAEVMPVTDGSRRKGRFVYGLGSGFLKLAARTPALRSVIGPMWRAATRERTALTLEVVVHPRGASSKGKKPCAE